ncbi:efflux RND transporter periplasmic adaptor subunit [Gudongella oleilytica]|uniref:efflux RND transporter periplasmic adaptor subunit n=1 Tax=Gudongella oleilytica TaxID=1582259 RepID=UPI002A365BD9|nr:efflux RND transporter periplasmic adaptor subunit [Gudongella oleilytica]MDY0255878.1 efflux RND transporter periplasmic adaptor subunit [Gudongella oleilytica]
MKKKLLFIGVPAIVIIAALGYFISISGALEVNASRVIKGDIAEFVEERGTVLVRDSLGVFSPVSGEVLQVLVSSGDVVKEGESLVKLDGKQAVRQLAELDAQIISAQAQLNDAKRAGNVNSIASLELDIAELSANIKEDESKLNNLKALYDAGALSQEEYRSAERVLEGQKLALQKLKLQLNQLRSPVSQNIITQYESILKQLQIKRESLLDLQGDFEITAGISGTVMNLQVNRGEYLQPGMRIMEIGDISKLYIDADVLVGDIKGVDEGTKALISSKDLGISNIPGKVKLIHPNAFSKISDLGIEQKRIKVEIELEGPTEALKPGYDMEIKLITNESKDTLIIPENSVFKLDGKTFVFVEVNGRAELREVTTGLKSGRQIEVLSGLSEGELVIESPDPKLEEGSKIKLTVDN